MQTNMPTTTTQELEISRLTGRRPDWQRRAIRTRLITALLVIVVLVGGLVGAAEADSGPLQTVEYRVSSGETLWDVAEAITDQGEDVRRTVRDLMDLNELDDSSLRVGQVILVPQP